MPDTFSQVRSLVNGIVISIIILAVFFFGALADRIFVIKPLDYLVARSGGPSGSNFQLPVSDQEGNTNSPLRQIMESGGEVSVADVSEAASKSVVTVAVQRQQQILSPGSFGGFFNFQIPTGEVEEIQQDIGTGFVAGDSGLVVTNKHVVSDSTVKYLVIDKDGKEHAVTNIYRDPANDLAILQAEDLVAPKLLLGDSDKIRVGEPVIAIGTALGEFRHTVTTGVISGLGRGIEATSGFSQIETLEGVIQTDAAINPGNSGGPLLNAVGAVIGVNVAVSAGAENIGFAIPINVVSASLDNFNETGRFDRPFLGVKYQMISKEAALANDLPEGAYLHEVVVGSVAAESGLEVGDIITKFAGQTINSEADLATEINKQAVGKRIEIEYWRDGERKTVSLTLRTAQEQGAVQE